MKKKNSVYISYNEDLNSSLKIYKDYTFVMYIASKKTYDFYHNLKIFYTVTNMVLSASLSVINSAYINTTTDIYTLKIKTLNDMNIIIKSGMVFNFIICINVFIIYLFELSQKEIFFQIYADNYLRLYNAIETETSLNKDFDNDFVKFILFEFTFLVENAKYDIPSFLKRKIKKHYHHYNIPTYLDVYIHNYTFSNYITIFKEYLNIFKQKGTVSDNYKPNPTIKRYNRDNSHHDNNTIKEITNIAVYDNKECGFECENSNMSQVLYNFDIGHV